MGARARTRTRTRGRDDVACCSSLTTRTLRIRHRLTSFPPPSSGCLGTAPRGSSERQGTPVLVTRLELEHAATTAQVLVLVAAIGRLFRVLRAPTDIRLGSMCLE